MVVYLALIDEKNGNNRERKDITKIFESFQFSDKLERNNFFFSKWLGDRFEELKKEYFPRKKGFLQISVFDDVTKNLKAATGFFFDNKKILYKGDQYFNTDELEESDFSGYTINKEKLKRGL